MARRWSWGLRATDDRHRVTTVELLFDLVFVYAITNVTALMHRDLGVTSVVEGVIVLALVWFAWVAYAWLTNQAKADEGLMRAAMVVALGAMFFVAVAIPHAFDAASNNGVVLVVGYGVVRLTHVVVYFIAAEGNRTLQSVVVTIAGVAAVATALLAIGVAVGGAAQKWWWLVAVLVDQGGVYFLRSNRWQLNSAPHFAERFGLIIIIALGESIVELGVATSTEHLTLRTGIALVCGIAIAVALWWLYFDVVALVAERVLRGASGVDRARLARDSYSYLHLPMVLGIVLTALGLVLLVAGDGHVAGGRYALYGGVALYLLAHVGFRARNIGSVNRARLTALVAVIVIALLFAVPSDPDPLLQLAVLAALLVALVAWEVRANAAWRARVRSAE